MLIHQGRIWAPNIETVLDHIHKKINTEAVPTIKQVGQRGELIWYEWSVMIDGKDL